MKVWPHTLLLPLALTTMACGGAPPAPQNVMEPKVSGPPVVAAPPAPSGPNFGALSRDEVNRRATRHNFGFYWVSDKNQNHTIDPDEIASLLFYPESPAWVEHGKFTPAFEAAYAALVKGNAPVAGADAERRKIVLDELDQGYPTLVKSDLRDLSADEKAFAQHIFDAAKMMDRLHLTLKGVLRMIKDVPADDVASQSLFRRNMGPKCMAPRTENNPLCSAIPGAPKPVLDLYPADMQQNPKFCEVLEKEPNAKKLLDPFSVVRRKGEKLEAVPYSEAYKELVGAIAGELRAAAAKLSDKEAPLKAYVLAAAQSFVDNDWGPADEAWSKMNALNSKFYLRVAPDEVYWETCSHKAGFHLAFARINRESLVWQDKLTPVQQEMEQKLGTLIGAPYKARKVTFHLPDFIDIIVNAGEDRQPFGGTIGQSLPNWGKVAAEGRGRTVAMSNLYLDPDNRRMKKEQAESLLVKGSVGNVDDDVTPSLVSTILHEATHNLGPANEYKYKGKTGAQWFGGSLASMMEELKAQTGGLYFIDFAKTKGILDPSLAERTYTSSIVWAFGHISRGMVLPTGERRPYSQLAAIQVGALMDEGALTFDANAPAANGTDTGAFTVHMDKMPAAVEKLMRKVGVLKATGDKAGAEALADKYIDGKVVPIQLITQRMLRQPRASFVYSVDE